MDFSKTAGLVQACHGAAAKAGKDGDQSYLPLWMHTADTAGVMEKLFEYRLSGQEKRLFIQAAGSEDEARKFFLLCGFLHDFGKMTAAFQTVMKTALGDSDRFEFPLPDHPLVQKYPHQHHTAAGLVILCSIGVPEWIASIAGAHHGKTQMSVGRDEQKILRREKPVFFGRPEDKKIWVDAWKQMLKAVLEICEIDSISSFSKFPVNLLLLLSGYVVEADWIASNTEYYPLIPTENSGDPKMYPGRIDEGWKKLSFTRPWDTQPHKMTEEIFVKMFGFSPNGFQIAMIDVLNHVEKPGLFLVEAPMGLGKTEAALTAADSLAGRFQSGGIFFGLPTQATANGLFSRFADWAEKEAGEQQQTLKLAHGSAAFNPEYQQIRGEASSVDVDGDKNQQGRLIVHEWMSDGKRGLISDYVIGTVDQALMSALNAKHVMLRHAGLAGKVVVIDEVHAYDAYMNVYFSRMLEWLGSYRVPVILLSATLPRAKREMFIESYLKGYQNRDKAEITETEWRSAEGYPSICWTDGDHVHFRAVPWDAAQQKIQIRLERCEPGIEEFKRMKMILHSSLQEGGCAGIIVNTVNRAQKLAQYLEENLKDAEIIVFHSRFTRLRRAEIEKEVLRRTGKKSTEKERNRLVVVGTQVIEQSLDIDFDVMLTEIAPMDLLLQRIGRLHRHLKLNRKRSGLLSEPVCYVFCPHTGRKDPASAKVYASWYLGRTEQEIKETVLIPGDIPDLVNRVYREPDDAQIAALSDQEKLDLEQALQQTGSQQNNARSSVMAPPVMDDFYRGGIDGLMNGGLTESGTDENTAVRDIQPSVSVVLLRENGDGTYAGADASSHEKYDSSSRLSPSQITEIMKESISLPVQLSTEETEEEIAEINHRLFSVWHRQPQLKYTLFLVMNPAGEIELGQNRLRYDQKMGLELLPSYDQEADRN